MKSLNIVIAGIIVVVVVALFGWRATKNQVAEVKTTPHVTNPSQPNTQPTTNQKTGDAVPIPLKLPQGYAIGVFAANVPDARDLQFMPDGLLLATLKDSGKVVALPDRNSDGKADEVVPLLTNLDTPHGMAIYNGKLYLAEETRVTRYTFNTSTLSLTKDKQILTLPSGGRHTTRSLAFDASGNLYISVGSTCDVCKEGNPYLGSIVITDSEGNNPRVFAKGLRNAVFITQGPDGKIWGTEMGRDQLGDETPPDEVNILQQGDFGWPYCYGNKIPDTRFSDNASCTNTIAPIFEIPAHSAPLGLTFINAPTMPQDWQGDLLVAYHGSWNRSTPTGYKIVRMNVEDNRITGVEDFLTGFIQGSTAAGRPVDVVFDKQGSLYISDDKAGAIYKLIAQ